MRKLLSATIAAATVASGALAVGQAAQAQPYGYYQAPRYQAPSAGYYDSYGRWHSGYAAPPAYSNGYSNGYYSNGYPQSYGSGNPLSNGLAVLGSVLGLDTGYNSYGSNVPVDRYGPDPNGMIAPDGHRIKCKLRSSYDNYYRQSVMRRECW